MAAFVFELESVLRQRVREEREAMRGVAQLERERVKIEDEIREQQRVITAEKRDLADRLAGAKEGEAVDLRLVRVQANASLHATATAQRAVLRLAGVHERLDRARLALLERSIDRRAMESLKERRREAWEAAERRKEEAALDELVVSRYGRFGEQQRIGGER